MNIYNNKDLKIVKSNGLIKKFPDSPIGYYKLAHTYLSIDNVKDAVNNFKLALSADENYVKAAIGLIVSYIYLGKYTNAAKEYRVYNDKINSKEIFKKYLCKMLNKYLLLCTDNEKTSLSDIIRYYFGYKKIEEIFKSNDNDILSILILTDGIIREKNKYLKVSKQIVLKKCVKIKWIIDEYRWEIFKMLKDNITDSEGEEILKYFSTVPANCADTIFINSIFEKILNKEVVSKIQKSFSNIKDKGIISSQNLWNYINKCKDLGNWNDLLVSCSLLISRGWIDSIVSECIHNLKNKGLIKEGSNEDKIVNLYGL